MVNRLSPARTAKSDTAAQFIARLLLTASLVTPLQGQSLWMWNWRTHPELEWQVIATENFRIHYHQGLESDALESAAIAEAAFPLLLEQLDVPKFGPIDIVLTNADEIMNGFARPNRRIAFWVNQNSAAGWFLGSRLWLEQIITHELQHVVLLEGLRTWLGSINFVAIPSWFVEGMAEYYSESWRVGRSDLALKRQVYRNISLRRLDAHHAGYAKILYMADRFGDSSLVKIVHYRQKVKLGPLELTLPYRFGKAVKEVTGVSLKQLDDAWRRTMQTYYFSVLGQLESVNEIGRAFPLPKMSRVSGLAISPDSSRVALIGRSGRGMRDDGLYTLVLDSTRTIDEVNWGQLSGSGAVRNHPAWSPDGQQLALSQYHRSEHGSLLWDIRIIDLESGKREWLTSGAWAHDPAWSPDGQTILYVGQQQRASNLFLHDLSTGDAEQLTHFSRDTVIQDPRWSPDGSQIAFSFQRQDGQLEIGVIDRRGGPVTQLTAGGGPNLLPLWSATGQWVAYTSFGSGIPNLFRVSADGGEPQQITNVAEGIYGVQILRQSDEILAMTLPDVDSVRVRLIPLMTQADSAQVTIREPYTGWRNANVGVTLPDIGTPPSVATSAPERYRWWKHWSLVTGVILPVGNELVSIGYWADALDQQQLFIGTNYNMTTGVYDGMAKWINTNHLAALVTTIYKDGVSQMRGLEDEFIYETHTGAELELLLPFNFGDNLTSNHQVSARLLARQRFPQYYSSTFAADTVTEGGWSVAYQWKHQRAHTNLNALPREGWGLRVTWEQFSPSIYGDQSYSAAWLEGFHHQRIAATAMVLYSQLGATLAQGDPPRQNRSGLYRSSPFDLHPLLAPLETGRLLVETTRILSPRGLEQDIVGDWAALASHELRLPMAGQLPVDLLSLGLADLTAALFVDYGLAAGNGTTESVVTSGLELKVNLTLAGLPLVTLAFGTARQMGSDKETPYLRLGTIQSF